MLRPPNLKERNRFFQLSLRKSRGAPKKREDRKQERNKADEADLLRNLAALERTGRISNLEEGEAEPVEEEEEPIRPSKPVGYTMPRSRFNAHLAVQADCLYILGGTYEQGDQEYTFDDMYAIDLRKLDGVTEIFRRDIEDLSIEESSESDGESEDSSRAEGEEDNDPDQVSEILSFLYPFCLVLEPVSALWTCCTR